ncbi:cytochrome c [Paracoccus aurantiacus]|uniref:Cytochrome c n=1 Tax=Paracoccus aurantiacus TaxID=2599412 RepID=A0A5C6S5T3_9RHOB|nr:cytochrome c [Paracoccus aurantiacus]TXB69930.1 cytochrome c [Paracoccus aurantiacus]
MRLAFAVLLAATGGGAVAETGATGDAAQGRAIFHDGAGLVPIVAGRALPRMEGRMPCAGCHGSDGQGGTEGGAGRAPAIRWSVLSNPPAGGVAYDAAALGKAIREGIAADGRTLQMPHFDVSDSQVGDIRAYLGMLDQIETQGISGESIALILPAPQSAAQAAGAAISAFNAEGGSYGRRVIAGQEGFVDLGSLLGDLRGRLSAAEEDQARSASEVSGWQALPRDDPKAPLQLRRGDARAFVGPAPPSLNWALANGADLEAARIHALTALILQELRLSGRNLGRSAFLERIGKLDLAPALAIYENDAGP